MVDRRRRRPGTNAGARDTRRASRPEPRIPRVVRKHGREQQDATRRGRTIFGLSTARAVILAVVVCGLALTLAVPLRTYFTQRSEAAGVEAERCNRDRNSRICTRNEISRIRPSSRRRPASGCFDIPNEK